MPKKNLAVQVPSIKFSVAFGNEFVGRNVKHSLFCPILTNKFVSKCRWTSRAQAERSVAPTVVMIPDIV
jgi:hypothetical protein